VSSSRFDFTFVYFYGRGCNVSETVNHCKLLATRRVQVWTALVRWRGCCIANALRGSAESEEDIFEEIDKLLSLREWTPPPPSAPLCGLCISTRKPERPTAGMLLDAKVRNTSVSSPCPIPASHGALISRRNHRTEGLQQDARYVETLPPEALKVSTTRSAFLRPPAKQFL